MQTEAVLLSMKLEKTRYYKLYISSIFYFKRTSTNTGQHFPVIKKVFF